MSMFKRNTEPKVVELLKREAPPYAEDIPLRLDAVRKELERLRSVIDAKYTSDDARKAAGQEVHFLARRLLDALSGQDA